MNSNHKGVPYLCRPYFPMGGVVLLNGPSSAGKSQLLWQLLNAVQTGSDFLGQPTVQGNTLLVNLDMPETVLWHRWREREFAPQFDLALGEAFNVMKREWDRSDVARELAARMAQRHYTLVGIDATAEVHGSSANNDAAPPAVYGAFRTLFPGATLVFVHHNRKRQRTEFGTLGGYSDEDALGSQMWRNLATVALQCTPADEYLVHMTPTKSQAFAKEDTATVLYREESGVLRPWDLALQWSLAQQLVGVMLLVGMRTARSERDLDTLLVALHRLPHDHYAANITTTMLRRWWTGWRMVYGTDGKRRGAFATFEGR